MAHDAYPFLARHRESHCQLIEFIEDLAGQLSSGRITVKPRTPRGMLHLGCCLIMLRDL
jgi:hypothetical protein